MVALGEFVRVEDGRCGVVVPPPSYDGRLAVWFGDIVEDSPVVEVVHPAGVRRLGPDEDTVYYH